MTTHNILYRIDFIRFKNLAFFYVVKQYLFRKRKNTKTMFLYLILKKMN